MPEEQLHGEEYMIMEEGGEREEREETDVSGNGDETFVAMTFTLPSEVINSARREATGGRIKRRVYGLGSESTTSGGHTSNASSAPSIPETPTFEEFVNWVV